MIFPDTLGAARICVPPPVLHVPPTQVFFLDATAGIFVRPVYPPHSDAFDGAPMHQTAPFEQGCDRAPAVQESAFDKRNQYRSLRERGKNMPRAFEPACKPLLFPLRLVWQPAVHRRIAHRLSAALRIDASLDGTDTNLSWICASPFQTLTTWVRGRSEAEVPAREAGDLDPFVKCHSFAPLPESFPCENQQSFLSRASRNGVQ